MDEGQRKHDILVDESKELPRVDELHEKVHTFFVMKHRDEVNDEGKFEAVEDLYLDISHA